MRPARQGFLLSLSRCHDPEYTRIIHQAQAVPARLVFLYVVHRMRQKQVVLLSFRHTALADRDAAEGQCSKLSNRFHLQLPSHPRRCKVCDKKYQFRPYFLSVSEMAVSERAQYNSTICLSSMLLLSW